MVFHKVCFPSSWNRWSCWCGLTLEIEACFCCHGKDKRWCSPFSSSVTTQEAGTLDHCVLNGLEPGETSIPSKNGRCPWKLSPSGAPKNWAFGSHHSPAFFAPVGSAVGLQFELLNRAKAWFWTSAKRGAFLTCVASAPEMELVDWSKEQIN